MITETDKSFVIASSRDSRLDSVKFGLILLVVTGHVLESNQFNSISGGTSLWNWIYMFHMPLFIFISGYFSQKKDSRKFLSSCWSLIEPLILFQLIWLAYGYFASGEIAIETVFTPMWGLWYLLSLLYWRILLQIIPDKILSNKKLVIIVSFAIGILAGFLPFDRFLSLQRTFAFLPFFMLGHCMRGKSLFIDSKYRLWCGLFLVALFVLLCIIKVDNLNLNHTDPYRDITGMYIRLASFALCIPMSVAFINVCPSTGWIATQGKHTLNYYLYHVFFIHLFMKVFSRFDFPKNLISLFLVVSLIILCISLLLRIPLFQKITNPSSFFNNLGKRTA